MGVRSGEGASDGDWLADGSSAEGAADADADEPDEADAEGAPPTDVGPTEAAPGEALPVQAATNEANTTTIDHRLDRGRDRSDGRRDEDAFMGPSDGAVLGMRPYGRRSARSRCNTASYVATRASPSSAGSMPR